MGFLVFLGRGSLGAEKEVAEGSEYIPRWGQTI